MLKERTSQPLTAIKRSALAVAISFATVPGERQGMRGGTAGIVRIGGRALLYASRGPFRVSAAQASDGIVLASMAAAATAIMRWTLSLRIPLTRHFEFCSSDKAFVDLFRRYARGERHEDDTVHEIWKSFAALSSEHGLETTARYCGGGSWLDDDVLCARFCDELAEPASRGLSENRGDLGDAWRTAAADLLLRHRSGNTCTRIKPESSARRLGMTGTEQRTLIDAGELPRPSFTGLPVPGVLHWAARRLDAAGSLPDALLVVRSGTRGSCAISWTSEGWKAFAAPASPSAGAGCLAEAFAALKDDGRRRISIVSSRDDASRLVARGGDPNGRRSDILLLEALLEVSDAFASAAERDGSPIRTSGGRAWLLDALDDLDAAPEAPVVLVADVSMDATGSVSYGAVSWSGAKGSHWTERPPGEDLRNTTEAEGEASILALGQALATWPGRRRFVVLSDNLGWVEAANAALVAAKQPPGGPQDQVAAFVSLVRREDIVVDLEWTRGHTSRVDAASIANALADRLAVASRHLGEDVAPASPSPGWIQAATARLADLESRMPGGVPRTMRRDRLGIGQLAATWNIGRRHVVAMVSAGHLRTDDEFDGVDWDDAVRLCPQVWSALAPPAARPRRGTDVFVSEPGRDGVRVVLVAEPRSGLSATTAADAQEAALLAFRAASVPTGGARGRVFGIPADVPDASDRFAIVPEGHPSLVAGVESAFAALAARLAGSSARPAGTVERLDGDVAAFESDFRTAPAAPSKRSLRVYRAR